VDSVRKSNRSDIEEVEPPAVAAGVVGCPSGPGIVGDDGRMPERLPAPYGSWPSPITVDLLLAVGRQPSDPHVDGDAVWFHESRPDESGRVVVRRWTADGGVVDVTPEGTNVRTRVHEYGGGAWAVHGGVLVYSTFPDGRVHVVREGDVTTLTAGEPLRFADFAFDPVRDRVVAVCEDHSQEGEPVNSVVSIDLASGDTTILASGHDFFSDPRISPAGSRMCWLTWDRPAMPWDGTSLWVADLDADGVPGEPVLVAGGPEESVQCPRWAPDGSLVLVSDRSGWWNVYRWRDGMVRPMAAMAAECGGPQWIFGNARLAVQPDGRVWTLAESDGRTTLLELHDDADPEPVASIEAWELAFLAAGDGAVAVMGYHPQRPNTVLLVSTDDRSVREVFTGPEPGVDASWLAVPEPVAFPTTDGRTAHGYYYPPTNPERTGPEGELPPLLVVSHGGPTSSASVRLDLDYQFWTSRGFAVVDVDYGGSTGYGRAYRNELRGAWGVVDLDDCTNAAVWLAEQGLADPRRLAIRGGSAGGYTTLCALAFRDVFACGTSYFGVGDLEALARDTHKFESRYLDLLVAPYPERVDVYRERSPIHHVDGFSCPVLLLQGEDDEVVPPAQAEDVAAALRDKGIPYAYLLFPGEGHGFRTAEVQRQAQEAELSFYAQVLGFTPADAIEVLELVQPAG
jgi:dipeptidyl aminopeptidase/acylaminoacyl peptidase